MSVTHAAPGVKPAGRGPHAPAATADLGPTRSSPRRTLDWTPCPAAARCGCSGTARIATARSSADYRVTELPTRWAGRAFRFEKVNGGEARDVFLAADGRSHLCDCEGFSYDAARKADARHGSRVGESLGCKHLDAARELVARRLLPDPHAGPAGRDWLTPAPAAGRCPAEAEF